jgi:hypothetical protein
MVHVQRDSEYVRRLIKALLSSISVVDIDVNHSNSVEAKQSRLSNCKPSIVDKAVPAQNTYVRGGSTCQQILCTPFADQTSDTYASSCCTKPPRAGLKNVTGEMTTLADLCKGSLSLNSSEKGGRRLPEHFSTNMMSVGRKGG